MKLIGDRILVEQFHTKDVTAGGIALPQQSRSKLPSGKIILMSQDVSSIDLSRGDVVLFSSIGAIPIEVRGREYVIIESEDVLMILDKGDYDAE